MSRLLLLAVLTLGACRFLPVDPAGKACDATHACPSGLTCLSGICVATSSGAGGGSGGGTSGCPPLQFETCSGQTCISTLAGVRWGLDGGLMNPTRLLAIDGGLLIADTAANVIREWRFDGGMRVVVGDGTCAQLCEPRGMAFGPNGELLIADTRHHVIRKWDGTELQIAFGQLNNPDVDTRHLYGPMDVAYAKGRLFIADSLQVRVLVAPLDGGLPFAFGSDFSADGGFYFGVPRSVSVSSDSTEVFLGHDFFVRSIRVDVAPGGPYQLRAGNYEGFQDGDAGTALFGGISAVAAGKNALYIADPGTRRIRTLNFTTSAQVGTLLGNGYLGLTDGDSLTHPLGEVNGMALVGEDLYFTTDQRIRVLKAGTHQVTTVWGSAMPTTEGCSRDVEIDPAGLAKNRDDLYFTDRLRHTVRALNLKDRRIRTLINDNQNLGEPSGLLWRNLDGGSQGELVIADSAHRVLWSWDLNTSGPLKVIAGLLNTAAPVAFDCLGMAGPALQAELCHPSAVAAGPSGEIFISDPYTGRIRGLDSTGKNVVDFYQPTQWAYPGYGIAFNPIDKKLWATTESDISIINLGTQQRDKSILFDATICGADPAYIGNCTGGPIVLGPSGGYWAPSGAKVIDRVSATGTLSILAGNPHQSGWKDGEAADARFFSVQALALEPDGGLFIADQGRIRYLDP